MGLMVSILIGCLGFIELFSLYTEFRRRLFTPYPSVESNLSNLADFYEQELQRERGRIVHQLNFYQSGMFTWINTYAICFLIAGLELFFSRL